MRERKHAREKDRESTRENRERESKHREQRKTEREGKRARERERGREGGREGGRERAKGMFQLQGPGARRRGASSREPSLVFGLKVLRFGLRGFWGSGCRFGTLGARSQLSAIGMQMDRAVPVPSALTGSAVHTATGPRWLSLFMYMKTIPMTGAFIITTLITISIITVNINITLTVSISVPIIIIIKIVPAATGNLHPAANAEDATAPVQRKHPRPNTQRLIITFAPRFAKSGYNHGSAVKKVIEKQQ